MLSLGLLLLLLFIWWGVRLENDLNLDWTAWLLRLMLATLLWLLLLVVAVVVIFVFILFCLKSLVMGYPGGRAWEDFMGMLWRLWLDIAQHNKSSLLLSGIKLSTVLLKSWQETDTETDRQEKKKNKKKKLREKQKSQQRGEKKEKSGKPKAVSEAAERRSGMRWNLLLIKSLIVVDLYEICGAVEC